MLERHFEKDTEKVFCKNQRGRRQKVRKHDTNKRYRFTNYSGRKIIKGNKPYNATPLVKSLSKAITGDEHSSENIDMFGLDEIKEIADYLIVYYESHKNGD